MHLRCKSKVEFAENSAPVKATFLEFAVGINTDLDGDFGFKGVRAS